MTVCQVLCRSNWCSNSWVRIERIAKVNLKPVQCLDRDGPHCRIRFVKAAKL